jgi:hypothetical protein
MKLLLTTMPGGGTSPSRDPVGKVGSAAKAASAEPIQTAATKLMHRVSLAAPAAEWLRMECMPSYFAPSFGRVTRRMVKLIRPPSASKVRPNNVDVPA